MKQAIIIFISSKKLAIMISSLTPDGQLSDLSKLTHIKIKASVYSIVRYILRFLRRLITFLFFAGLFFGIIYFLDTYQNKTERKYGFTITTPYLSRRPPIEPIMINTIDEGEIFEKAGFKVGDIIHYPQFRSVSRFSNYLKQPSGAELWLEIIRIKDFDKDLYLEGKCKTYKITFVAP